MSQKNKGIYCILLSSFFFALMNLFVRLSGDLPSIQKSFFRNFVAMLCLLHITLHLMQVLYSRRQKTGGLIQILQL